jgi:hypothetical protein
VDLDCGELARRRVEVPIGQHPGYRATSDPVTLPAGNAAAGCAVDVVDSGVDPGVTEQPIVLAVDGVPVAPGLPWRLSPSVGGDRQVVVDVTFAALPASAVAAVGLPPLPTAPTASGDQPVPVALAVALVGLFATGLAAALAQSWRRWLRP